VPEDRAAATLPRAYYRFMMGFVDFRRTNDAGYKVHFWKLLTNNSD